MRMALIAGLVLSRLAWPQVPVEQEPRHHLAFENEWLRVLEPQIPAGDTTLEHLHDRDDATVCIHGSRVRGKPSGGEWSNPGMVCVPGTANATEYTGKPRAHTVQNVGSEEYHLTLVENLRPDGWTSYDAIAVTGMKVVKENRAFRIYDLQLAGAGVPAHTHAVPVVAIAVSGEVMAGEKRLARPGEAIFIPAGKEHRIAAAGDARVVEVEVR